MKKVSNKKENTSVCASVRHLNFQKNVFSLHRRLLLLAIMILGMVSCNKDNLPVKNAIPFKTQFEAISETLTQPSDAIQKDHITGSGIGTSIGKFDFEATVTYNLSDPSPLKVTGTQTITTANGEKIYGNQDSYSPDPDENGNFQVIGTVTITGGTGKYAHTKGTLNLLVKGNFENSIRYVSLEGLISF